MKKKRAARNKDWDYDQKKFNHFFNDLEALFSSYNPITKGEVMISARILTGFLIAAVMKLSKGDRAIGMQLLSTLVNEHELSIYALIKQWGVKL